MADFFLWLGTLALLVKEFLLAAAVAAIVVILALVVLLEALEARVMVLAALELGTRLRAPLIAAAIWSILDLATFFAYREALGTFTTVAEAETAVAVSFAFRAAHATLTAYLVVGVTGPRAALPERATVVGALLAGSHTVARVAPAEHVVPGVLAHVKVHVLLSADEKCNAGANNALFHPIVF